MKERLSELKYWLVSNTGKLSRTSKRNKNMMVFLGILLIVLDANVKITFGSVSFAGLGIGIDPPQVIPIGVALSLLLLYKLIAFWVSVFLEVGTSIDKQMHIATMEYDPSIYHEDREPHDMSELIKSEAYKVTTKWTFLKVIWEVIIPNTIAIFALCYFLARFFD